MPTRLSLLVLSLVLGSLAAAPRGLAQQTEQTALARRVRAKVDPRYPDLARQYQLSGKVRLEVTVAPDGAVKQTHVLGGNALLVGAALEAAKQWKYEPGPRETVETVDFLFQSVGK